jgi:hypothetical protein
LLVLALYYEITKGTDSFWFPYITILPNIEFSSFWDEKEVQQLSQDKWFIKY